MSEAKFAAGEFWGGATCLKIGQIPRAAQESSGGQTLDNGYGFPESLIS
jgi:hypothetical protein